MKYFYYKIIFKNVVENLINLYSKSNGLLV